MLCLPSKNRFSLQSGVRQHYFVETDHEIFPTAIFSLPLIQEGQLSVSGERMRTHIGESLTGLSQSRKSAVR